MSAIAVPRRKRAVRVDVARSLDDFLQVATIRALVYMGDQHCPFAEEFDGNDLAAAIHLVAREAGEPIGVLRMRFFAEFVKVERVAVRADKRGGLALTALIDAATKLAARKGYRKIIGHIQARLLPLWRRYGGVQERVGRPRFVFSDHEYVEVERDLAPAADAIGLDTPALVLLRPEGDWDRPGVLDRSAARAPSNPMRRA